MGPRWGRCFRAESCTDPPSIHGGLPKLRARGLRGCAAWGRLRPQGSSPPGRRPPEAPRSCTLLPFSPVHSHVGASVPQTRTYPSPSDTQVQVCISSVAESTVFTIFPKATVCNGGSPQRIFWPQGRPWGSEKLWSQTGLQTPPGSLTAAVSRWVCGPLLVPLAT